MARIRVWTLPELMDRTVKVGDCMNYEGPRTKQIRRRRISYTQVRHNQKSVAVHRLVYSLSTGLSMWQLVVVRHSCDNPRCINPEHLVHGSYEDNNRDMRERGRARFPFSENRDLAVLGGKLSRRGKDGFPRKPGRWPEKKGI